MVRVFVSIPVPNSTGLEPLVRDLGTIRGVKVSPISQLHITLCFIGDVPEERLEDIERCVSESVSGLGPARISLKGAGAFPNDRDPKVIWAGVDTELPLKTISERLTGKLKAAGIPFDDKPFKAHITVGRVIGRPNIGPMIRKYATTEFASFICRSVLVMKSDLTPSGAVHTILGVCDL